MSGALSPFHAGAREAIARGWAVFPLRPRDKVPDGRAAPHGCKDAVRDVENVDRWWRADPARNVALATGPQSGVWVLDVDGEAGFATLAALEARHGPLPATASQTTGKGRHFLFAWPDFDVKNSARKLGDGLDVRGAGGYIVLAPSIHPSGRAYQWICAPEDHAPAQAPDWLLDLVRPPEPKPAAPYRPLPAGSGERATRYGEKALDDACRNIAAAKPGTRHNTLSGEAAGIGELIAGGEIERAYGERALINAATAMMGGAITQRELSKITWGLQIGAARPRRVTKEQDRAARPARAALGPGSAAPSGMTGQTASPASRLVIRPPDEMATLIVTIERIAEDAAAAWERHGEAAYGLFACADLDRLAGGMALNFKGAPDWLHPRPHMGQRAETMRWKGRVFVVLPNDLKPFTVNEKTKWERFIPVERQLQVISMLAAHWWKAAGASDVQCAVLPEGEGHV